MDDPAPAVRGGARVRARLASALVVVVLGSFALAGAALADPGGPGAPAPASDAPADARARAHGRHALTALLDARASALLARDRGGWMAAVSTAGPAAGFAARQGAMYDDVAAVPLAAWRWEVLGDGPALPTGRRAALGAVAGRPAPWVAHVALVYRLRGAVGEVRRDQYLTVTPTSAHPGTAHPVTGWALSGDTDGPTARDLWDLGRVEVVVGERSLVLGTGDLGGVAALADAGAARVDDAWGEDWPRTTVVEVPASAAQAALLLQRADASVLDGVAAVTTGDVAGAGEATSGDRVVLNPRGFAALTATGRLVVMTHELVHVATRSSTSAPVPPWLSEGYADWVAYRGQGITAATIAAPLLDEVGAGAAGAVAALPSAADLDPTSGHAPSAYAGAWLAVDLLARRGGERAPTDLYRDVARGRTSTDAALRARLGTGADAFTADWRSSVTSMAREER